MKLPPYVKIFRPLSLASSIIAFSFLLYPFLARASAFRPLPYYGQKFFQLVDRPQYKAETSREIFQELNKILNGRHLVHQGDFDEIVRHCPLEEDPATCYGHRVLEYTEARKIILSRLHLEENYGRGRSFFSIKDVYCQRIMTPEDFPHGAGPSPDHVPDATIINIEHTWPQSKFTHISRYSRRMQKTDLHHLFPVQSKINGIRESNPFGEVKVALGSKFCEGTKIGRLANSSSSEKYFEPPMVHRGNVARALFYFSVKYEMPISESEEFFLRKWHKEDPVDEFERIRNERIFGIQRVRNPFIDYSFLVDFINDF